MKEGIHPEFKTVTVQCACGAEFESGSTVDEIRVEICSQCHPFFTGKQKLVDSAGRVERFYKKYAHMEEYAAKAEEMEAARLAGAEAKAKAKDEAEEAGQD